MQRVFRHYMQWLIRHWRAMTAIMLLAVFLVVLMLAACYRLITPYERFIVPASTTQQTNVGLVLGAGIRPDGKPYKELQSRLDTAAAALERGQVSKLILSGDNRFEKYDEPTAMHQYLQNNKGIADDKLILDYAGRSTYESCERAAKVFGLNQVTLISARSHLPRAIFLCRHFAIEAYGLASPIEANDSGRREILARVKAVLNVYIRGEQTVLGEHTRL